MNNANQCPKCKTFILGTYCSKCNDDIKNLYNIENMFGCSMGDMFSKVNKTKDGKK